ALGWTDEQPAGQVQQPRLTVSFELLPEVVRALHQRNVRRLLEVRLADDARLAVRRAQRMPGGVGVEAEDASAALREVEGRGAAHGAEANDDHIEGLC